ncbi:MAG: hypothetical protein GX443_15720 [Deltaproteobacteria bacterium]|nr:hypothetical protein [Deltaproteobacteria bacterium]
MGFFKDLTQELNKKPWVPFLKKEPVNSAETPAGEVRRDRKPAAFCLEDSPLPCVTVCTPKAGCPCGCEQLRDALEEEIGRAGLQIQVGNLKVGCGGFCEAGPFLGFPHKAFFYLKVRREHVHYIVHETLLKGRILFELLSIDPERTYRTDIYYDKRSGLIATIHEGICMVEVAKYFLDFEENVSCGKCVPCRLGMKRMHESMEKIVTGRGTENDLLQIRELCHAMIAIPHCEFAMTSSRPVLSAVTHFEDEFRAHIEEKRCPAGVCKELMEYQRKQAMRRRKK